MRTYKLIKEKNFDAMYELWAQMLYVVAARRRMQYDKGPDYQRQPCAAPQAAAAWTKRPATVPHRRVKEPVNIARPARSREGPTGTEALRRREQTVSRASPVARAAANGSGTAEPVSSDGIKLATIHSIAYASNDTCDLKLGLLHSKKCIHLLTIFR